IMAAVGARTPRNLLALGLTIGGVATLTEVRLTGEPLGFVFAFANCAGFLLYIVLGHWIANTGVDGSRATDPLSGIDQLGAAMLLAAIAVSPLGFTDALPAFAH